MNEQIQKNIAEAVTGKPLEISVKCNDSDEVRDFKIKQPSFGLLIETSRIFSEIELTEINNLFENKNVFKFISVHGEKVLSIISMILDNKVKYREETFEFLKENLTAYECYDLLANIALRIGIQDFQKSIIGMIPMSLLNQGELIASMSKKK